MALVPTITAVVAGNRSRATNFNELKTAIDFSLNPPRCFAYRTVVGSTATGTWQAIGMDGETTPGFDSASMHDPATNTSRVVCQYAGLYHVEAKVSYVANATGLRGCAVRLNSAGAIGSGTAVSVERVTTPSGTEGRASLSIDWRASVGDYFELFGYQNSGGALNLSVNDPHENMLQVRWVSN